MDWNSDHSSFVRKGFYNGLPYPPGSVSRKPVPLTIVEAFNSLDEPDISLVNEVEEIETAVLIIFCYRDDKTEVRVYELILILVKFFLSGSSLLFVSLCKGTVDDIAQNEDP
jgi:hypothetical protein